MSSEPEHLAPEGDIQGSDSTYSSIAALVLAFASLPSVLILIWLAVWALPNYTADAQSSTSQAIATHQANAIGALIAGTQLRIEQAAQSLNASEENTIDEAQPQALASAATLTVIRLSDLGIASLDPSDYGLTSHILLDLVRRAYNKQSPSPEAVKLNGQWTITFASPWSNGAVGGVLLAQFPGEILSAMATSTDSHQVALVQNFDDDPSITILDTPDDMGAISGSARVPGTQWVLRVAAVSQPTGLISFTLPWMIWLPLLAGMGIAFWLLTTRLPKQLADDVTIILDTVDTRIPIALNHGALKSLAIMLRQLSAISRRKNTAVPRKGGVTPISGASQLVDATGSSTAPDAANTDADETEILGWRLSDHGYICCHFDSLEQDNNRWDQLAAGVANFAQHASITSYAIGYSGSSELRKYKTNLLKKLLSNGVDVVDLEETTLPLLNLAINDGAASSYLYLQADDSNNELRLCSSLDGRSASREQWRSLLHQCLEPVDNAGNGRTIKLDLRAEYTERISLDVAMEDPMRIVIGCPDQLTLALANESLAALGCDTETVLTTRSESQSDQLQIVTDKLSASEANLGFLINASGERLRVISDAGLCVRNDHILMLLGKDVLERHPGNEVLFGPSCTRNLPSYMTRCGGSAKMVSASLHRLQSTMESDGAILAGDTNGNFIIRDRWFGVSDAIYSACRLVE
ncbi:MAG: hypothetical protein L7S45_04930, partial [Luminiphilus sp.]|nr:hypothetical protein [Luminiphilus sp.]